jgi:hypothetical protein
LSLDVEDPADDVRVGAEPGLPERMADHHGAVLISVREGAAEHGLTSEHLERAGCHHADDDLLRPGAARQRGRNEEAVCRVQPGEGRSGPEIDEITRRDGVAIAMLHRVGAPQHHQPVWIAVGERFQEHCVDDREDRRVGANAERQGGNRQQGEDRIAGEDARGVTRIEHERLPPHGRSPSRTVNRA